MVCCPSSLGEFVMPITDGYAGPPLYEIFRFLHILKLWHAVEVCPYGDGGMQEEHDGRGVCSVKRGRKLGWEGGL